MKKTLQVEGMMCEHCVAHVKQALEGVPGISLVSVSLAEKEAIVEGEGLEEPALKEAVEKAGYSVKKIA